MITSVKSPFAGQSNLVLGRNCSSYCQVLPTAEETLRVCILGGRNRGGHLGILPTPVSKIPVSQMLKLRHRDITQLAQGHRRTRLGLRSGTIRFRGPCFQRQAAPLPHSSCPYPLTFTRRHWPCCLLSPRKYGLLPSPRLCPPASQASTCIQRPEGN